MDQLFLVLDSLQLAFAYLLELWWIYLPFLFFFGLIAVFQSYNRAKYLSSLNWILLEVRVPRNLGKSPKATEQIFSALHGILIPVRGVDAFFKGKMEDWFSLEIVSIGGEIHFFIRTLEHYKKLVESQVYAQYPDAEIAEVEDYMNSLPQSVPDDQYDLWGAEFILNKPDAYPIRTYPEFEEKSTSPEEIKRIDPLASLEEVLSSLEPGEYLGIQLLIRPTGEAWIKKAQTEIDKLQGKTTKISEDFISKTIFEVDKYIPGYTEFKKEDKKEEKKDMTPGKQDVLKAIEHNLDRLAFNTGLRFVYIAPKDIFHRPHISGVIGSFKQFASPALNGFKLNMETAPVARWLFKGQKIYRKKAFLLHKFKNRLLTAKSFVFNTEELATIYHFPDVGVRTPNLPRIETKKGEAPPGLPIG